MITLSDNIIKESLFQFSVSASPELCAKIRIYVSILSHWNKKISLTSVKDPIEILRFHFGESLFAAHSVPIINGRLADVGSGPGFPGLPLKLAVPSLDLVLLESNGRKAAFLAEVVRELKLDNIDIFRGRIEDFPEHGLRFDFVTARAVGQTAELLNWSRIHLAPSGRLALWLGADASETVRRQIEWNWRDPILIPGSRRRNILIGSPQP